MTLSNYLIDQMAGYREGSMPPHMIPLQTPTTGRTTYQAQGPPGIMQGMEGSQFGMQHGMSPWGMNMSQGMGFGSPGPGRFTQFSEEKVATLQSRLAKKLGPEYITQRPGPGGGPKLSYIEGWKVINLANDVFGFNGWSSSITRLQTDFMDVDGNDRCKVGITAIIRITLLDGCYHEDVGYGQAENIRGKGAALEKAQKEAVTDGIKRALKHFGNVLGNCLYDRDYTKEVQKVKLPPAKFNANDLERRPEFTPQGGTRPSAQAASAASAVPQHVSGYPKPPAPAPRPVQAPPRAAEPASRHVREDTPPLRSIDELVLGDDPDLAFTESESLFDEFDESVLGAKAPADVPMLGEGQVPKPNASPAPGRNGPTSAPAYQHRHRPDMPPPAAARQNAGASSPSESNKIVDSGDEVPRRKVGGFAMPNGGQQGAPPKESSADKAAAARRRAAMSEAINASFHDDTPKSKAAPIPSGGVDRVASRASANLRQHGANLDINNPESSGVGAFSSARGIKREGSRSPTKRPGGPRAALSDISHDANEWQSKRSRVM